MEQVEREKYLTDKLNSYSESLLLCLGGLSSSNDDIRNSSLKKINRSIEAAEKLCEQLGVKYLEINSFCNVLMSLKKYSIPKVDYFLRRHSYEEMIYGEFTSTLRKFDDCEELSETDYRLIELLITINGIKEDDEQIVYERLIKEVLERECHISMDSFKALMVLYAKSRMKKYIETPEAYIQSNRKLKGSNTNSLHGVIYLNKEELENMYVTGSIEMLIDIYHEIAHIKQYVDINVNNVISSLIEREFKEEILSSYLEGYYEDNYSSISSEIEAEKFALKEIIAFFERNEIPFNGKENIMQKIDELEEKLHNPMRHRAGKKWDVDDLFKYVTNIHPELLELYGSFKKARKEQYD